jgi:Protein of unknown function (DUF3313)
VSRVARNVQRTGALCAFLALAACLAPIAPRSDFLGDLSRLERLPGTEAAPIWRKPGADLARYDKVVLDPVEIRFVANDPAVQARAAAEFARLKTYFRQAAMLAVSDGYTVVGESGPGVLRVRAAVTGLRVGAQATPPATQPLAVAIFARGAVLEAELRDSASGERVAAFASRRGGNAADDVLTTLPQAEAAFDGWAGLLRARLAMLKSASAR